MANTSLAICSDNRDNVLIIDDNSNPKSCLYFRNLFNLVDSNNDGYISYGELKNYIVANDNTHISEKVIKRIYKKFDINKDEKLDFEEFQNMVLDPDINSIFQKITLRILKRMTSLTGMYEKESRYSINILGIIVITIIQIILFYVNKAQKSNEIEGSIMNFLSFKPCYRYEIYRYLTYIFVHSDEMHLYGNLIIQILIGIPLEFVHSWRVLLVYFSGALGGCIAQSVVVRRDLVGASGAVFAIYTAHIAAVIMNWREMSHPAVHLIIFGIIVIIDGVYVSIFGEKSNRNVSYLAHGGGAVVGLILGIIVLRNIKVTKRENILWYCCCITLGIITLIFVLFDIWLPLDCKKH